MKIKENHKSAEDLLSTFEEDLSKLKAALEEIKSADSDEKVSAAVEKLHNENKKLSEKIAELNKINEAIKSSADKIAEASKAFEKAEKDFADKKNADKLPNDEADKVVYDKGISSVKGIKVKGNLKKKKLYIVSVCSLDAVSFSEKLLCITYSASVLPCALDLQCMPQIKIKMPAIARPKKADAAAAKII